MTSAALRPDDDTVDVLLRTAAAHSTPIADAGFTAGVMHGLPPQRTALGSEHVVIPLATLAGMTVAGVLWPGDAQLALPAVVLGPSWPRLLAAVVPVAALAGIVLMLLPRDR